MFLRLKAPLFPTRTLSMVSRECPDRCEEAASNYARDSGFRSVSPRIDYCVCLGNKAQGNLVAVLFFIVVR